MKAYCEAHRNIKSIVKHAPHSVTVMPFNARPATRFCTRLWLDWMLKELLRRLSAAEGDGEDNIEEKSDDGESRSRRPCGGRNG